MDGRTLMTDFDNAGEEPESDYWLFSHYLLPANAALRDFLGKHLGYRPEQQYWLLGKGTDTAWK